MESQDTGVGVVTAEVVVECDDERSRPRQLRTQFGYRAADPYAVTATFFATAGPVTWTFARELLVQGMLEPAGLADVHVWPCLDERGRAVVIIELSSPDGQLVLQAMTSEIQRFVHQTLVLVPAGAEDERIDLDTLVDQLLGSDAI